MIASRLPRYQSLPQIKSHGATYTPPELADFVAEAILKSAQLPGGSTPIRVLDPAVGDGELLHSLIAQLPRSVLPRVQVRGFDTDPAAVNRAETRLKAAHPLCEVRIENGDFLEVSSGNRPSRSLFVEALDRFDLVIANPPYVRTQIMGATRARHLAKQYGLTGRVDLYAAFVLAINKVTGRRGTAGIIVSNRFMTTRSGAVLREALRRSGTLRNVWDFGDTKLFDAAVLPAVLVLSGGEPADRISFCSIYETTEHSQFAAESVVAALQHEGVVKVGESKCFRVQCGYLAPDARADAVWRLQTASADTWLATVERHTTRTFGDVGKIRVGVKTCADKIFIRSDWDAMPDDERPELLLPVVTHHIAGRFRPTGLTTRQILYPYEVGTSGRAVVNLDKYPRTRRYVEAHRATLASRSYLIEGGREWFEIWVPQDPAAWRHPKLIFRDISEKPTFWVDTTGAVVNGDCYWLVPEEGVPPDVLWLAAAVANSTFIEQFYDRMFNNKLYSGRRRFMTQYVERFPLPDDRSLLAGEIVTLAKCLGREASTDLEHRLDDLVWRAFGLRAVSNLASSEHGHVQRLKTVRANHLKTSLIA